MMDWRGGIRLGIASLILTVAVGGDQTKGPDSKESQDYTIRTTSRLVLLDVSVKNAAGGYASGLTKDNFKVYEDGKLQEISQFADADIPVTVGILVDESGSMRSKKAEVVTAALSFVQASNPQDEVFVINFNERARRGLPDDRLFSDNIQQLRLALWQGIPEGRTALYDAMDMAIKQLSMGRRDKKALVVVSDGGDNVSTHKLSEIMHEVVASEATIYTIGIFDEDDPEKNPGVLRNFANVSGGEGFFPHKLDEINLICKQIAKDIRTRYTIGYIPEASGKPERHIKVVATASTPGKLVVRTRQRYLFTAENEGAATK